MEIRLLHQSVEYVADLSRGIDLSTALGDIENEVKAWGVPDVEISPVQSEGWVGSVEQGSPVNFYNIRFNPHGNGTHTESYGHIHTQKKNIGDLMRRHHFIARLIELKPEKKGSDSIITADMLDHEVSVWNFEALIVKTGSYASNHNFTGTNPPYFEDAFMERLKREGVQHLLTDLPSVDREQDGGKLLAHKSFWNYTGDIRKEASITELLRIPDGVPLGLYLLNLQLAPFVNDASPSRPVIFPLLPFGN